MFKDLAGLTWGLSREELLWKPLGNSLSFFLGRGGCRALVLSLLEQRDRLPILLGLWHLDKLGAQAALLDELLDFGQLDFR